MIHTLALATITALVLSATPVRADSQPDLKEGLWSVHTQSVDNPGNKKSEGSFKLCRSHAFDQHTRAIAKTMKNCTTKNESFVGNKYTSEASCLVGKTTITSKGAATFQGDTSAHSETHSTFSPPMYGISDTLMVMDQKYLGSCPAGVSPGDRVNRDGTVMHSGKH